jgi:hypothetical protein
MAGGSWLVAVLALITLIASILYYEVLDARNEELQRQMEEA